MSEHDLPDYVEAACAAVRRRPRHAEVPAGTDMAVPGRVYGLFMAGLIDELVAQVERHEPSFEHVIEILARERVVWTNHSRDIDLLCRHALKMLHRPPAYEWPAR